MNMRLNSAIIQVLFMILLLLLVGTVTSRLFYFLPGILGAIALYILSRENVFQQIYAMNRKPWLVALMYIVFYVIIIGTPFYLCYLIFEPKLDYIISNPEYLMDTTQEVLKTVNSKLGLRIRNTELLKNSVTKISEYLPTIVNSVTMAITNFALMLFLLYYLLVNCKEIENTVYDIIPLKDKNKKYIASESKKIIKTNALGLPIIAIVQGITASLGYYLFGIDDYLLWGFITGIFSFLPVVGTMIAWVPLAIYLYATDQVENSLYLTAYSILVTSNVDYLARITVLKKIGDAHPVITIFGIIVGVDLFGFIGLVFGPLLLSYLVIFYKVYICEYCKPKNEPNPVLQKN